jgi:hypothetical protein
MIESWIAEDCTTKSISEMGAGVLWPLETPQNYTWGVEELSVVTLPS